MSMIKGGQSKGDRDSMIGVYGTQQSMTFKNQERRESIQFDKKSVANPKEQKTIIENSPYQPALNEDPYNFDKN